MSYHYKVKLSKAEWVEELEAILARGNHKSATVKSAHVSTLLTKDVTHGLLLGADTPGCRTPYSRGSRPTDPQRGREADEGQTQAHARPSIVLVEPGTGITPLHEQTGRHVYVP